MSEDLQKWFEADPAREGRLREFVGECLHELRGRVPRPETVRNATNYIVGLYYREPGHASRPGHFESGAEDPSDAVGHDAVVARGSRRSAETWDPVDLVEIAGCIAAGRMAPSIRGLVLDQLELVLTRRLAEGRPRLRWPLQRERYTMQKAPNPVGHEVMAAVHGMSHAAEETEPLAFLLGVAEPSASEGPDVAQLETLLARVCGGRAGPALAQVSVLSDLEMEQADLVQLRAVLYRASRPYAIPASPTEKFLQAVPVSDKQMRLTSPGGLTLDGLWQRAREDRFAWATTPVALGSTPRFYRYQVWTRPSLRPDITGTATREAQKEILWLTDPERGFSQGPSWLTPDHVGDQLTQLEDVLLAYHCHDITSKGWDELHLRAVKSPANRLLHVAYVALARAFLMLEEPPVQAVVSD